MHMKMPFYQYTIRGIHLRCNKGRLQPLPGWTGKWSLCYRLTTAAGTVLRKRKDGSWIPVPCPEAVIFYNEFMGGVDRGDQLRGYYSCRTKSRKFYKYIFYFLLDVSITNAFVMYKHYAANSKYKISGSSW